MSAGVRGPRSARARALGILREVERGAFAVDLFAPKEDRFVRELVLGVLRRQLTLDALHAAFGRRAAAELDPDVRIAVRLGIYQLQFLDGVPPHAAVSESVAAAPARGRTYVNAVLRQLLRESHKVPIDMDRGGASPRRRLERPGRTVTFFSKNVFPDPEQDLASWVSAVHSHPAFLVERWLSRWGEEPTVARLARNNAAQPWHLRPRAGRGDAAALVARLHRESVLARALPRPGAGADAVEVAPGQEGLLATRAFREGLFSVQDVEQMDAAELLAPRPGEVVWDACAAPGGKATQLAELEPGARVVATDASDERLALLRENVARLGLGDAVVPAVHDVLSETPPPGRPPQGFDAILLDAPCSNTAVLGRRPEARWRLQPDTFALLGALQRRMLERARVHLRPGGRLVLGSCSFEPEETSDHGLAATRSPLVWIAEG